jgi:tRNA pseudouridine38-40 synthase
MRNLRLVLAYDGTEFGGWQRQPRGITVQGTLEAALGKIVGETVRVYGSGRTDAGVHALHQVANFKTGCRIPCRNLIKALNDLLPPTIRVKGADEVPHDFHARYHVRSKTYRYRILQAPVCSPFLWRFVYHYPFPLDVAPMAEAARQLEGEHDFTSFAGSEGHGGSEDESEREPSRVRTIFRSSIIRRPATSMLIYEVQGSGFLHHMVRNIVGTLIEVGRGKLSAADVPRILAARDRTRAGPTAPACGLCLVKVEY